MLNQKFFGLSLWVWLVIGAIVYYTMNSSKGALTTGGNTKETFAEPETTSNGNGNGNKKIVIYNFNTKWCGWSRAFQPEWDKFMSSVKSSNIEAKDVKCDDDSNSGLCENSKYDIPGFPYVVAEVGDKIIPYNGPRTVDGLTQFVSTL